MDITVYLPDEIGAWAKAANLNLSATLREAVLGLKEREDTQSETLKGAQEFEIEALNGDGRKYTARFTGARVVCGDVFDVYLTEAGDVIVQNNDAHQNSILTFDPDDLDAESLRFTGRDYVEACHALGITPVIDL